MGQHGVQGELWPTAGMVTHRGVKQAGSASTSGWAELLCIPPLPTHRHELPCLSSLLDNQGSRLSPVQAASQTRPEHICCA